MLSEIQSFFQKYLTTVWGFLFHTAVRLQPTNYIIFTSTTYRETHQSKSAGMVKWKQKMMKSSGRNTTLWKWQNKTEHGSEYTNPNIQSILTVLTSLLVTPSQINFNLRSTLGQNSLSDDRQLGRVRRYRTADNIVSQSLASRDKRCFKYEKIWQVYFELRILISDPLYLYQTWELLQWNN